MIFSQEFQSGTGLSTQFQRVLSDVASGKEGVDVEIDGSKYFYKKSQDAVSNNRQLALQSSTIANKVEAIFLENKTSLISGSYVEFAERRVHPIFKNIPLNKIESKHRRDGFEASNADKIFESTFIK